MDAKELRSLMRTYNILDNALLFHAYKPYMRDYEMIVEVHVGPAPQGTYSYLFKFCVEVNIQTSVPDDVYTQSLDEELIDYETGKDMDGYLWGVNWSLIFPGWELRESSETASQWSKRLGLPFHELLVKTNAYTISLIFSELSVKLLSTQVDQGISQGYFPLE